MSDRSRALPQLRSIVKCDTNELTSARHRIGKRRAPGEKHGDPARQRAAGAVRARRVNSLALPAGHIVFFDQRVGERVTLLVAALDQDGAPMLADQVERRRDGVFLAGQPIEFRQVRGSDGRYVHQPSESSNGRVIGKRRAAGRDHHWVEYDRKTGLLAFQLFEPPSDLLSSECASDHADLHRVDADVTDDRVDLREDHFGRDRVDRGYAHRVLGRNCRDGRHCVAAKHRNSLDVGLNPRAAARIEPAMMRTRAGFVMKAAFDPLLGAKFSMCTETVFGGQIPRKRSRRRLNRLADVVDNALDERRIVALCHDPDQRLRARFAYDEAAPSLQFGFGGAIRLRTLSASSGAPPLKRTFFRSCGSGSN